MLIPKKVKHRKHHRGSSSGKAMSGNFIAFGSFGLKAMENSWVTSRQIEAARRAMTRYIERGGKIWIRIFPDKPITSHGNESPMGAGKGAVDHFVAVVQKGRIMFEMDGVTIDQAQEAMRLASHKLPIKTRFTSKEQK
jgi:large subunit ribosomal protein L16